MAKSHRSLYGNVPDKSNVALLLIDVINDLEFPEGKALLRQARPMARKLAALKQKARTQSCPVIYVNDNFGRWRSDFKSQVEHCLHDDVLGKPLAEMLAPGEDDYFVLKPAHSGFYSTTLELLLKHLEATDLILTGVATNLCVQFTANDAYFRGYRLYVPRDCVAANTARLTRDALDQMKNTLKAATGASSSLPWSRWSAAAEASRDDR